MTVLASLAASARLPTCLFAGLAATLLVAAPGCGGKVDGTPADGGADAISPDTGGCTLEACGPAPGVPSYRCWDGSLAGAVCARTAAGTCGWTVRGCPPEKACSDTPGECGAGYCLRKTGVCSGAGLCAARPDGCDLLYAPVCGCDGKTYGNACAAGMAGMNVAYEGECKTGGKCASNADCTPDRYCALAAEVCVGTGVCTPRPAGCPDVYDPVCGCDGFDYGNACDAASAGVNVATKGSCPPPPKDKACGGLGGIICKTTEWCDWPTRDACGATDGMGLCKPRPSGCSKEYAPVCGCDGTTYGNACLAHAAGVDDRVAGPCK